MSIQNFITSVSQRYSDLYFVQCTVVTSSDPETHQDLLSAYWCDIKKTPTLQDLKDRTMLFRPDAENSPPYFQTLKEKIDQKRILLIDENGCMVYSNLSPSENRWIHQHVERINDHGARYSLWNLPNDDEIPALFQRIFTAPRREYPESQSCMIQ